MKNNMDRLGDYLKRQDKDKIYLTFKEIELIIGESLPRKAHTSQWWYNDARRNYTQSWLSNGYITINAKDIPSRNGVEFQRYKTNVANKIIYSTVIVRLIELMIIPIAVMLVGTMIWNYYNQSNDLNHRLKTINSYYNAEKYEKIEEEIYEIIPILEEQKNYGQLCELYDMLYHVYFSQYSSNNLMFKNSEIEIIRSVCRNGLEWAERDEDIYYMITFYNNLGAIYQYQYGKTMDLSDANTAIRTLEKADELYAETGGGIIPVLNSFSSTNDLEIAIAGMTANLMLFEIQFEMVQNGEYTLDDIMELSEGVISNNIFFEVFRYLARSLFIYIDITCQVDEAGMDCDYSEPIFTRLVSGCSKYYSLFYTLTRKYDLNDGMFTKGSYSLDDTRDKLFLAIIRSMKDENYEGIASIYMELARIYYYNWMFEDNDSSVAQFEYYFMQWFDWSNRKEASLDVIERYFDDISNGILLDLYIEELEEKIYGLSYTENPFLYAYTKYDLAKHYFYKANELAQTDGAKEEVSSYLAMAKFNLESAFLFFSEDSYPRVYREIEMLLANISDLESSLE